MYKEITAKEAESLSIETTFHRLSCGCLPSEQSGQFELKSQEILCVKLSFKKEVVMKKVSSEPVVNDIRRKTRKKYSSEEKIRIVLEGLRGEDSIATS